MEPVADLEPTLTRILVPKGRTEEATALLCMLLPLAMGWWLSQNEVMTVFPEAPPEPPALHQYGRKMVPPRRPERLTLLPSLPPIRVFLFSTRLTWSRSEERRVGHGCCGSGW